MTWLELIKMKLSEEKAKGKSPSIGDVTPLAKKEWVQIKEGKHPLYMQGKAQTFARKKKTSEQKTRKNSSRGSSAEGPSASELHELLEEVKLCGKCKKKVEKVMKKKGMRGGSKCGQMPIQKGGKCGMPIHQGGNCTQCGMTGGCACGVM